MSGNLSPPFFEPPPLGGGVPVGKIFLRDTGTWYNYDIDGDDVDIPQPTIVANDDLFVFMISSFGETVAQTGWTKVINYQLNQNEVWHRVATGDSNDAFHMPVIASNNNRVAQMCSFGNSDSDSPPQYLQKLSEGGLTNGGAPSAVWPYLAITSGATDDGLIIYFSAKVWSADSTPSVTNNSNVTEIGTIAYNKTSVSNGTILVDWGYVYDEFATSHPAGEMTYSPSHSGNYHLSQYTRWHMQI